MTSSSSIGMSSLSERVKMKSSSALRLEGAMVIVVGVWDSRDWFRLVFEQLESQIIQQIPFVL